MNPVKAQLEMKLYRHSPLGWAAYTHMKHLGESYFRGDEHDTTHADLILMIWKTLDKETRAQIREIRKL